MYSPIILLNQLDQMHIQSPRTKLPSPLMPIRALKVRTPRLARRRDIPAPAALISDEGPRAVRQRHLAHKLRVGADAGEPVVDGERRTLERGHELRHGGLLPLGED